MANPLNKSEILNRIKEFIFGRPPIELESKSSQLIVEYLGETLEDGLTWERERSLPSTDNPTIEQSRILTAIKTQVFDRNPIDLPSTLSQLILSYAQGTFFEPKKGGGQSPESSCREYKRNF